MNNLSNTAPTYKQIKSHNTSKSMQIQIKTYLKTILDNCLLWELENYCTSIVLGTSVFKHTNSQWLDLKCYYDTYKQEYNAKSGSLELVSTTNLPVDNTLPRPNRWVLSKSPPGGEKTTPYTALYSMVSLREIWKTLKIPLPPHSTQKLICTTFLIK